MLIQIEEAFISQEGWQGLPHIPPEPPAILANEALTDREREILQAIARGERSKEIAARLGIGIRTVGSHITSIYLKLNVASRASAVAAALERGLLEDRGPPFT